MPLLLPDHPRFVTVILFKTLEVTQSLTRAAGHWQDGLAERPDPELLLARCDRLTLRALLSNAERL